MIGAGIAGMAAGRYGRMNVYRRRILELHRLTMAATTGRKLVQSSWRRHRRTSATKIPAGLSPAALSRGRWMLQTGAGEAT
jgi:hypothetical protein